MATAGLKLDDGSGGFATNCFPVRTLFRQSDEAAGAWLVAHRAEQRRRFKAVLCTRPRTFSQIREERRKADKGSGFTSPTRITETQATVPDNDGPVLDGFFLLRHCCVEDPSHLCSVKLAGQELSEVKEDDLEMFDNVAYVNAAENYLPFEAFHRFPIIRELEMPLNGLRGLKMQHGLFPHLEMLDLSFNNLSEADVLSLGMLPNLKVLQLSGNGFRGLPEDMALPYRNGAGQFKRFPRLEILMLDDNKFSDVAVFACLAGLRCLRQLNLEKNDIFFVPQLLVTDGRVKTRDENFISHKHKKSDAVRHAQEAKLMDLLEQRLLNTPRPGTEQGEPLVENPETEKNTAENTISGPSQSNEQLTSVSKSDEDLLTDDFSTADLSARISDLNLVEVTDGDGVVDVSSSVTVHDASLGPPPPPFSELRLLNLAHNQICSEEALLAVAAWPMLVELIIHDNPLTDEHTGDPPLLKRFLGDRLGINLIRKKPQPPGKKTVEISTKKSRTVKTTVPKIPKVSVEERLMLEAPESLRENRAHSSTERHRVLPPITSDSQTRASSAQDSKGQRSEEVKSKVTVTIPTTTEAWTDDLTDEATDNPFFMTQVDESDGTKQEVSVAPTERELQVQELMRDERYKGYEDLLDIDPALDFVPPKDISGNIRALKYALGHELVFRDPVAQLDVVKRPARQYRRSETNRKPAKTRQQRVDEMLKNLKQRTTVEEAELREVLRDKKKLGKKFPEAETLLEEIQHRYNAVRVTSMSEANTSRNLVRETLTSVQEVTGSASSESVREQQGVA